MFVGGVVERVQQVHDAVAALCAELDPDLVGDHELEGVFDGLVAMGRRVDGAVLRLTARYDQLGAWKRAGERSAADHRARKTGTSPAVARRAGETSKRLAGLPGTDRALAEGQLSAAQADQVASGAAASPQDEQDLLDVARREGLHNLRRRAAEARARADGDREARHRRQHRARRLSRWIDEDGLYNLLLKTTPERGAEIDAFLKPRIDRCFADARNAGRFEPVEAYAADVTADLLTGTTTAGAGDEAAARSSNPAVRADRKVIATIDVTALNRGWVQDGETCVIAGVGPVSVPVVRAMLADAFVALVITNGLDVANITHLGRQVTAHQRSALEHRGYACEIDGCGSTHHLDIDHVTGWTLTHTTRLDDLAWLCGHHHNHKTRHNLILQGPIGKRHLTPRTPHPTRHPPPRDPPEDPPTLFTTAT